MTKPDKQPAMNKGHWLILHFKRLADLRIAMPLSEYLYEHGAPLIYFSRYTDKPLRIEIKCQTSLTTHKLRLAIKAACIINRWPSPLRIICKPFSISVPHAIAWGLVRAVEQQGCARNTDFLRDVTHWMYNMAGFSYAQEAESALREAHMGLMSSMGKSWQSNPYFEHPKRGKL